VLSVIAVFEYIKYLHTSYFYFFSAFDDFAPFNSSLVPIFFAFPAVLSHSDSDIRGELALLCWLENELELHLHHGSWCLHSWRNPQTSTASVKANAELHESSVGGE